MPQFDSVLFANIVITAIVSALTSWLIAVYVARRENKSQRLGWRLDQIQREREMLLSNLDEWGQLGDRVADPAYSIEPILKALNPDYQMKTVDERRAAYAAQGKKYRERLDALDAEENAIIEGKKP